MLPFGGKGPFRDCRLKVDKGDLPKQNSATVSSSARGDVDSPHGRISIRATGLLYGRLGGALHRKHPAGWKTGAQVDRGRCH